MKISENTSLKPYNTFGIDTPSRYFTELHTLDDVAELVKWKLQYDVPLLLIGGGSNLLFRNDFQGMAALVCLKGKEIVARDNQASYVRAAAGENWHEFVRWTLDKGLGGLENLSLIPGTVGAAPMQNIGAYGVEIKDLFHALQAVDLETGQSREFDLTACEFGYRDSFFKSVAPGRFLITSVTFRLPHEWQGKMSYAGISDQLNGQQATPKRISDIIITIRQSKLPDPKVIGNAGSFFKNPVIEESTWNALKIEHPSIPGFPQKDALIKTSAAWLIDQCGWKGYKAGDAGIYEKHALVLVNHHAATGEELWAVAEAVIASVKERFGITLEPEPRVL